jgi:hypothetical protein
VARYAEFQAVWFNNQSSTGDFKQTEPLRTVLGIICQFTAFDLLSIPSHAFLGVRKQLYLAGISRHSTDLSFPFQTLTASQNIPARVQIGAVQCVRARISQFEDNWQTAAMRGRRSQWQHLDSRQYHLGCVT